MNLLYIVIPVVVFASIILTLLSHLFDHDE